MNSHQPSFGIHSAPFNYVRKADGTFRIADANDNAVGRSHVEENAMLICAALNFYYLSKGTPS